MSYNPYLYPANPRFPNRALHAVSEVIPDDILSSIVSFLQNSNLSGMASFDIYQAWSDTSGIVIRENPDLVLSIIDYIAECVHSNCDMGVLSALSSASCEIL